MTELKGRTALVTGAGGGLGSAIARALSAQGVDLALSDRPGVDLTALLAEVTARGVRAECVEADLMDRDQRLALVPDAAKAIGPLDILVNNAGVEYMRPSFTQRTAEDIEIAATVNLLGVMQLTHAVLPGMIGRGHGSVVTISSIAGKMALPFDPTYCATKYGVAAFMRSLASEMGRDPVSFSTIFPGYIREAGMGAPMDKTVPPALLSLLTRHPDDVAKAVVTAIRDRRTEIVVSRQPTTVPAVLNAIAPRLWNASAHTLTGRGKRLLRAIGRAETPGA